MMRSGVALVVAPSIALATQSVLYASVMPGCAHQSAVRLHATAAGALVLVLVLFLLAWCERQGLSRALSAGHPGESGSHQALVVRRFTASLAVAVTALSALVIGMMWLAVWMVSPCLAWP